MNNYNLRDINVLVIDDNHHVRLILRRVLSSLGVVNFWEAKNGEEAYKQLNFSPSDFIFCDWEMEPMNGLEFIKMIRTKHDSPCPLIPIVMLSSYTEIQYIEMARDAGANDYLAKPISPKLVYNRICRVIESQNQFIRSDQFVGPDRRHISGRIYSGDERRLVEDNSRISSMNESSSHVH